MVFLTQRVSHISGIDPLLFLTIQNQKHLRKALVGPMQTQLTELHGHLSFSSAVYLAPKVKSPIVQDNNPRLFALG
ncbi:hypothetical protein D3C75_928460 [compost metagenome]